MHIAIARLQTKNFSDEDGNHNEIHGPIYVE